MPRTDRIRRIATWLALAGSIALAVLFVVHAGDDPVRRGADQLLRRRLDRRRRPDRPDRSTRRRPRERRRRRRPSAADRWRPGSACSTDPADPRPAGDAPIPYGVVRSGALQAVDVTWSVPAVRGDPARRLERRPLLGVTIVIAAFVFARRPDEPAATALMIAACAAGGSSVPWFLGTTVSDVVEGTPFVFYALITGPLYMLLWPAGLHLALVFPTPTPVVARHRGSSRASTSSRWRPTSLRRSPDGSPRRRTLEWVGTWPVATGRRHRPGTRADLALFVWRYRRAADPATRTRIRWAWLGVIASGSSGSCCSCCPSCCSGGRSLPESWIGHHRAMPLPLGLAAGSWSGTCSTSTSSSAGRSSTAG